MLVVYSRTFSSSEQSGNVIHLVHHTRGTACVENYWFCEIMIQRERELSHEVDLKDCLYFEHLKKGK